MIDLPMNAVQRAIYDLLCKGETVPTYDFIPKGVEPMPYIWLGSQMVEPTDLNKSIDYTIMNQEIHVWSDKRGKKECNDIMNEVTYLMTRYPLNVEGYHVMNVLFKSADISGDLYEDGKTAYHGVLTFTIELEQET